MSADRETKWDMETIAPLPPQPVAPGWLITFADLLSLLLAFFVLMFAATSVSEGEWRRVVRPIAGYFSGATLEPLSSDSAGIPQVKANGHDLAYVKALFDRVLADGGPVLAGTRIVRQEHRLVVALPVGLGAAGLTGGDPPVLGDIARLLAGLDNKVIVETTIVPQDQDGATVNYWQRALDQSLAIAAELSRLGDTQPIGSIGLVSRDRPAEVRFLIDETVQAEAAHGSS